MLFICFLAAIWTFSAWENNLVGAWGVWVCFGIMMFPFLLAVLKQVGTKNARTVVTHCSDRKAKSYTRIA